MSEARSFLAAAKRSTMISLTEAMFEEIKEKQADSSTTEIWLADMFTPASLMKLLMNIFVLVVQSLPTLIE